MKFDVSASATDLESAVRRGEWYAELPDGVVGMSANALEDAYHRGVIASRTLVLRPGAPHWEYLADALAASKIPPPPSSLAISASSEIPRVGRTLRGMPAPPPPSESGDPFDSTPPPSMSSLDEMGAISVLESQRLSSGFASVAPMATDIAALGEAGPRARRSSIPWQPPPARFDGAFGPRRPSGNDAPRYRLVFAVVLTCALAGGFFAATGTRGLRVLAARVTGAHAVPAAPAAAPPPSPAASLPPAATAAPAATAPLAAPTPAPPTTGIPAGDASSSDPNDAASKAKRRHLHR